MTSHLTADQHNYEDPIRFVIRVGQSLLLRSTATVDEDAGCAPEGFLSLCHGEN